MRTRERISVLLILGVWAGVLALAAQGPDTVSAAERDEGRPSYQGYRGSSSCRPCHERFYELWAPSHHGLAMQPYTARFAEANLTPQAQDVKVGTYGYRALVGPEQGYVLEKGPDGEKRHPIVHALGGKNVYYFLTLAPRGRLQTLPVAYDVGQREWFDTAASGVRHFPGVSADEPVHWTDRLYTFNTSCFGCHVSQISTNYELKTDTYRTEWVEPGINCETCHGPGEEHVKVCQAAPEGQTPQDLKLKTITVSRGYTVHQTNASCASCHAKMNAVSAAFEPGDRYFDHFDLITLDHTDFYPDGRDLGENYTYTSWRMSPCVKSGKLDCVYCHTSSGRYRFKDSAQANHACLPCHQARVENAAEHTHHEADSEGSTCIACHMPMTDFARMRRSDHSMRPPVPAATLEFKSPNACNICHADQDAAWADEYVRQWHKEDYQEPILEVARLADAARKQDFSRLDEMLDYISRKDRDEVIATSLIRLLSSCDSQKKWPVIIKALKEDPSPLVRAGAAQSLDGYLAGDSFEALLEATSDEYRLVRVRAAASLATVRPEMLKEPHRGHLEKATAEFKAAMTARPDDNISHYNLGNFYADRREYQQAADSFETAIRLRPDFLPPYVNVAFAYNAMGQNDKAEQSFRQALALDPKSLAVHLNLGMLLGERGRVGEAEETFRKALQIDPNSAVAAYNLGVILSADRTEEALKWCQKAYTLRPDRPGYAYTYAFYLNQAGSQDEAVKILNGMVARKVAYADAYTFLGAIYMRRGEFDKAREIYEAAARNRGFSEKERQSFEAMAKRLQ